MSRDDVYSSAAYQRYFGTRIAPQTFDRWLELILLEASSGRRGCLALNHNLHSLYWLHRDPVVRELYARCESCYIDGMGVLLVLFGACAPTSGQKRFSLMDTFPDLLEYAQHHSLSLFYLGSSEAVVDKAQEKLRRQYPGLKMELHHGYFQDNEKIVDTINAFRPDLLLVGMGMPKQEAWLMNHIDKLDVAVATQAGATLDYFTGAQAKPPLWMSRLGLAWAYRLLNDPARLWRRYLLEPWALLGPTLRLWRAH